MAGGLQLGRTGEATSGTSALTEKKWSANTAEMSRLPSTVWRRSPAASAYLPTHHQARIISSSSGAAGAVTPAEFDVKTLGLIFAYCSQTRNLTRMDDWQLRTVTGRSFGSTETTQHKPSRFGRKPGREQGTSTSP